jgi:diaminopimelate epimerase
MKTVQFIKAVASGNDFVIVDTRSNTAVRVSKGKTVKWTEIARRICERKWGLGADGLLVLEGSDKADVRMRVFNPDGSEVTMCGNGARCVAFYCGGRLDIETGAGVLQADVQFGKRVKVRMIDPSNVILKLPLDINGHVYEVHTLNTGVPHAVYFAAGLDDVNVKETGRLIRRHPHFQPDGTNADFVDVRGKHAIAVRTYERGVEDETLACGTGACAAAVIASLVKGTVPPVDVHTKSGETLKVYFTKEHNEVKDLYLEGEVRIVSEGRAFIGD